MSGPIMARVEKKKRKISERTLRRRAICIAEGLSVIEYAQKYGKGGADPVARYEELMEGTYESI